MKRSTALLRSVLALALIVAVGACTGDDDADSRSTTSTSTTGEDGPREGGVLRVGVQQLTTLDPAQARTVDQVLVADHLFDGLAAYAPTTLEPEPAVAAEWSVSEDQRQWTFTLDPAARFTDGTRIVASDVKFTLERIARPETGSPVADLLEPVTGYRAFAVDATAESISGITAPAEDTLQVSLDQPLAVLPSVLANPAFGIVAQSAVEAEEPVFEDEPVGSGPWRFHERDGSRITLRPAEETDAFLDGVEIVEFDDADAAYRALTRGGIDFVSQVPPEDVEEAEDRFGGERFRPYIAELFYGFNLASPKFADPRFREAIVRAVDQRSIIRAVYSGTVLPLDGLVLQGVPGHQEGACGDLCVFDRTEARELIEEAFPDGNVPEINIDFDEEPTQEAVAKAIQAGLDEVGIRARLRPKPLREYQDFAVSGDQELFRLGWIAAYASPDAFLPPLFLTDAPSNLTGFSSPDVDAQLKLARAEPDTAARRQLYQAAERSIMEQLPVVPIAQFELHSVARDRVRDLEVTSFGTFDATEVWLAAE